MDPFTLEPFQNGQDDIVMIDNCQFHLPSLYEWIFNRGNAINPVSEMPFSPMDILHVSEEACLRYPLGEMGTSLMDPITLLKSYFGIQDIKAFIDHCIRHEEYVTMDGQSFVAMLDECPTISLKDLGVSALKITKEENAQERLTHLFEYYYIFKSDVLIKEIEKTYEKLQLDDLHMLFVETKDFRIIDLAPSFLRLKDWVFFLRSIYKISENPTITYDGCELSLDTVISTIPRLAILYFT